jgi:hypothetical protein
MSHQWNSLVDFINDKPIDSIIKRTTLLKQIGSSPSTIDKHRTILCKCGYLGSYVGKLYKPHEEVPGRYKVLKHIETEYDYKDLYNLAYKPSGYFENGIRYKKLNELLK